MHIFKFFLLFSYLLISCHNSSYDVFRQKGRVKIKELITDLKSIKTKDQLVEYEKKLIKSFNELDELVLEVKEYQKNNPALETPSLEDLDYELSFALKNEIQRIQRLEGGKEILNQFSK